MRTNARSITLGVIAGAALALSACSSGTPEETTNETPNETTEPQDTGTAISVIESEFSIALSDEITGPGVYTFEIHNDGNVGHNLHIEGPGISGETSSTVGGGGETTLTVTLESGTYTLWCTIGSHRANGMELEITVP